MSAVSQQQTAAAAPVALRGSQWLRILWPWLLALAIALILPRVFTSGHAITMLNQMAVMIVFALSYNMLLGNTGLLSFGHAVYFGLGAFCSMHVLRAMNEGLALPIELLPLVAGFAGLFFGIIFGAVSVRRAGVVFAMISLGLGELVHASSYMFTGFFGGEAGLFGDRDEAVSLFGINYGPNVTVYYLVVVWALLAAAAMFLLRKTPLGWMANAVRDNPERAQFVGYSPQLVRFFQFCLSAFFAGLAGGLFVLTQEIVTDEAVGAIKSGTVLLSAYIGGIGTFLGPVFGATLVVYLEHSLSSVTDAWMLYFGLLFMMVVMFAPMGLFGTAMQQFAAGVPVIGVERWGCDCTPSF
ncbi:branched-chain amino acid ABC transporter permease [Alkalilimnicola ehrlichii]|uniref:Branched-chain amino acid ABC transporter permease n=1 Tax=Alkalilimnicola ehrlichii TaxID=351052 RepID=A0A3E0WLM4_9GAMM|nr:branched-chain amino acid ABC transporter permease [Alkalilimnicola ehrlichii]RFA25752.1 branched-chain amino acid ABC transporter permease [Alkalilimnicola ehrlichii]RFA32835.1 branched-chain amino acid ABC transporter permease [Alkalilimnicola ehrlichii]